MIELANMLLIGAAGRNAGKTELACALIRRFCAELELTGIKVTIIRDEAGRCPRGGEGCGVCASLEGRYLITQETGESAGKDTARMLAAGCRRVFWLRVLEEHLLEGFTALLERAGREAVMICESNGMRQIVEPGLFLMVKDRRSDQLKPSARGIMQYADQLVQFDGQAHDLDLGRIHFAGGAWGLREPVSVIILAGGASLRMGRDKSLLPVAGLTMIEHIYRQLQPRFQEVLISSNEGEKFAFLGARVIPDREPGQGPLMGIASALEASATDLNFFVACDIPRIDLALVERMLEEARGFDGVVPVTSVAGEQGPSRLEPLFAVYRKTMLAAFGEALRSGERRIRNAFDLCRINYFELMQNERLENLNTASDYEAFRSGKGPA